MNNNAVESFKQAGTSAIEVVKEFAARVQQERESVNFAGTTNASAKNNLADTAKQWSGNVLRAAEGTRDSASFQDAKSKFTTAFNEARNGATEAYNSAKQKRNSTSTAPTDTINNTNVIDGEVVDGNNNPGV